MAISVHAPGACLVKIGVPSASSGALQDLGYTRNMADVTREAFWVDIPGDQNGGDDGPPIDIIHLGEIARIRLELTKWDSAVSAYLEARLDAETAGLPPTAGSLMFGGSHAFRLLLHTPSEPMNFPRAFARNPIEIAKGTKYSSLICEFEAHKDASGVLYNAVTS